MGGDKQEGARGLRATKGLTKPKMWSTPIPHANGDLAPKAKVLCCHQPLPYTAAKQGDTSVGGSPIMGGGMSVGGCIIGGGTSAEGWHVMGVAHHVGLHVSGGGISWGRV